MQYYREIRALNGQRIFVRESREQRRERIMLRIEIVLAPIVAILVWAKAAGMI